MPEIDSNALRLLVVAVLVLSGWIDQAESRLNGNPLLKHVHVNSHEEPLWLNHTFHSARRRKPLWLAYIGKREGEGEWGWLHLLIAIAHCIVVYAMGMTSKIPIRICNSAMFLPLAISAQVGVVFCLLPGH